MASYLPWLLLGGAGLFLASRGSSSAVPKDTATPGAPMPLRAGVPYLFLVRLEATEDAARETLESKGVENLMFTPASVPPFWAKVGDRFGTTAASFKATPAGNSSVTLGQPFYGIGRLEVLVRLDGQPFATPAPAAEA